MNVIIKKIDEKLNKINKKNLVYFKENKLNKIKYTEHYHNVKFIVKNNDGIEIIINGKCCHENNDEINNMWKTIRDKKEEERKKEEEEIKNNIKSFKFKFKDFNKKFDYTIKDGNVIIPSVIGEIIFPIEEYIYMDFEIASDTIYIDIRNSYFNIGEGVVAIYKLVD